jgi:hypothetical protein
MIRLQRKATEEQLEWFNKTSTIYLPCEIDGTASICGFTKKEYIAQAIFEDLVEQGANPELLVEFAKANFEIGVGLGTARKR